MDWRIYRHFAKTVSDYDTIVDNVVMENDKLQKAMLNSIPFGLKDSFSVLDLGCGTGHGSLILLEKFKKAKVVGVDFSDKMIKKSKRELIRFFR